MTTAPRLTKADFAECVLLALAIGRHMTEQQKRVVLARDSMRLVPR